MLRSLRARLLLLTVFVAGTALVAVALASRRAVSIEYGQLEMRDRATQIRGAAEILNERVRRGEGLADADAVLERLASASEGELLLLGPEGEVAAASSPALRSARVERGPGDRLEIVAQVRKGGTLFLNRTVLVGSAREEIRDGSGALLGTLVHAPRSAGDRKDAEPPFVRTVTRWLLLSALGSGALALVLTLALSRRILGPVESLTAAARRMGAGDLSQRVRVSSADEIGELARAFNAMAEAVERNEALRRNLVSDVAHELRTPLTNLRGQIEALEDGLLAPGADTLRSLHEEVLILSRLVNDLQDLALAEAGQLPLHRGRLVLSEAIEGALASIRAGAAERGVLLHAEAGPELAVDADRERLGQVLRNLLANALTHTPDGGRIEVTARAENGSVAIRVQDTGVGISAEQLPRVFDRFYRADSSRARASGGAGLGLAIVKQLVIAHGGTIGVESEPGRGAAFTFTIPRA